MKRKRSLLRTAALKARQWLQRKKAMSRRGRRAEREEEALKAFRGVVLHRAGWACERCGRTHGLHAHHILPRARGGKHDPANGACLCSRCHGQVHDHVVEDWRRWVK